MISKVIRIISETLKTDEKVIFAYVYGSFINGDQYRDIDVAVYCSEIDDIFSFQADRKIIISDSLEEAGYDIAPDDLDLRVINHAPYDFVIDILDKGHLIVDKEPETRAMYIEKISMTYRINQIVLSEFSSGVGGK